MYIFIQEQFLLHNIRLPDPLQRPHSLLLLLASAREKGFNQVCPLVSSLLLGRQSSGLLQRDPCLQPTMLLLSQIFLCRPQCKLTITTTTPVIRTRSIVRTHYGMMRNTESRNFQRMRVSYLTDLPLPGFSALPSKSLLHKAKVTTKLASSEVQPDSSDASCSH